MDCERLALPGDAESQLSVTGSTTYLYDGDGRRVAKANTAVPPAPYKLYWYGPSGEILGETDGSGNTLNEYVFLGGKRLAMLPAGATPILYAEDLLGTSRVNTTNAGVVCYDADFYPYGGERAPYTDTCTQNFYKFEGKERDTETGNDDFGARYYSNRFGRWLSADWSNVPVAVPYANLTNPQTLNLYSMVADDPESFTDLDGHCDPEMVCAPGDNLPDAATTREALKGIGKEVVNTGISTLNLVSSVDAPGLDNPSIPSGIPLLKPSNDLQEAAMGGTAGMIIGLSVLSTGAGLVDAVAGARAAPTVTRYMGQGEAAVAESSGSIPNVDAAGNLKSIHVTTDTPLDSAAAAKQKYELPADPSHRATIPANQAGPLGPTPDGRPTTSGGGSQAATQNPIPVRPDQIKKLDP